ncbi:YoaK family protein [Oenococcus alcoholitolerans]|uniref:YoaK family protein n=1 Tax=Oenococcus alcoholitolerans TaxID=931074 RepID=UPI003F71370A
MGKVKESLPVVVLLGTVTGYVDAITFQYHGGRFASMQTGNLIQSGISLVKGQYLLAASFFFSIVMFSLGTILNLFIRRRFNKMAWELISLLVQMTGIALVAIFAEQLGRTVFVYLLAFFMGIQADTFSKLNGSPVTTVMSTGNVKNGAQKLVLAFIDKDKKTLKSAFDYTCVALSFLLGAFMSTGLVDLFSSQRALIGASFLLLVIMIMLIREK